MSDSGFCRTNFASRTFSFSSVFGLGIMPYFGCRIQLNICISFTSHPSQIWPRLFAVFKIQFRSTDLDNGLEFPDLSNQYLYHLDPFSIPLHHAASHRYAIYRNTFSTFLRVCTFQCTYKRDGKVYCPVQKLGFSATRLLKFGFCA